MPCGHRKWSLVVTAAFLLPPTGFEPLAHIGYCHEKTGIHFTISTSLSVLFGADLSGSTMSTFLQSLQIPALIPSLQVIITSPVIIMLSLFVGAI